MAATALAVQEAAATYAAEGSTQFATLTMTAGDATNGNKVVIPGSRVLVLAHNSSGDTAYDLEVTSSNDKQGRTADILQELAFGDWHMRIFTPNGWEQTLGGKDLQIDVENAAITLLAIPL
jgi:hypothetical protein